MKVAMLTAGGLAPCLSATVGGLIRRYTEVDPDVELIAYLNGYRGLLLGETLTIDSRIREQATRLLHFGGSPIGNGRVKLYNTADCVKRKLIREDQIPFEVAAQQLVKDGVTVLHTIGGDGTSMMAADLAKHLKTNSYSLQVIGLPKTIDNDISPIQQSLGAWTAAEQGAIFFENIVAEHSANPRMLIVHEVMGRHCGWLTFATTQTYLERLSHRQFVPEIGLSKEKRSVHGMYVSEMPFNFEDQSNRLREVMDRLGCVNIFVSEDACSEDIVEELENQGKEIGRDIFGRPQLPGISPAKWLGKKLAKTINAEKLLVQRSGYFVRSAAPNVSDLTLIQSCVGMAVESAFRGDSGLIGHDEENSNKLRCIEFLRVKGGKTLNLKDPAVLSLLEAIGQS
jgi:pyrophosphate--fructose-6-phosphate 1-phosphotransferase